MIFKDSQLAYKYCIGKGIEIGAAAHNPFNLEDCINLAPQKDKIFYDNAQKDMCGFSANIDIFGTADCIPVEDNSFDYIINSHVIEHIPDLIGTFKEWNRIIKKDGIIFMIVPKRDALPSDKGRPLSTIDEVKLAHKPENKGIVDEHNHIWVFSLETLVFFITMLMPNWKILEALETDDKVGNGHCVVCQKI